MIALLSCLFPFVACCNIENITVEHVELYSIYPAYQEAYLKVSERHALYYAQYGNPLGKPVIVLHGGPGAGCSPSWTDMFDPEYYRVIMLDQRGAGRSTPAADMEDNTSEKLVSDIEALRNHLGIDKWFVFGGSWGSALAILYGETHPDKLLGFVLRGIFTGREVEYVHLVYGMRKVFPEAWEEMASIIPFEEREDLIAALDKRLMDPDPKVHLPAAHAFMRYDTICGTLLPEPNLVADEALDDAGSLSIARAFIHYAANQFFLQPNQLYDHVGAIAHLPVIIVHGRYDTICPASNAYDLYKLLPNSKLWFISNAGHFTTERPIAHALREAMDQMKAYF